MSQDNVFAKIIRGELPSEKVYEDEQFLCIKDISPLAPVHFLVIPKEPIADISQASESQKDLLGSMLLLGARLAREHGIEQSGYRLVLNCGDDAGLMVPHLHLHVVGGAKLGAPA